MLKIYFFFQGCAKHIEFSPLRSTDVTLPEKAVFVIAHSLTSMNKAATADFNCRVIECRLAAQVKFYYFKMYDEIKKYFFCFSTDYKVTNPFK